MARKVKDGESIRIDGGHTWNHDDVHVDVGGMTGTVEDSEGYEKSDTGEHMLGVKLDAEHGGGHVFVPESRLRSGRGLSFATMGDAARKTWDRIFGA